ncbi:Protein of unknown function [Gryllus bimaculatus]|nr:Protein of unknown function [Gryllus bimaculatus]
MSALTGYQEITFVAEVAVAVGVARVALAARALAADPGSLVLLRPPRHIMGPANFHPCKYGAASLPAAIPAVLVVVPDRAVDPGNQESSQQLLRSTDRVNIY